MEVMRFTSPRKTSQLFPPQGGPMTRAAIPSPSCPICIVPGTSSRLLPSSGAGKYRMLRPPGLQYGAACTAGKPQHTCCVGGLQRSPTRATLLCHSWILPLADGSHSNQCHQPASSPGVLRITQSTRHLTGTPQEVPGEI